MFVAAGATAAESAVAQDASDPARLSGLSSVGARVEATWDELITTEAGGATTGQFLQALRMSFEGAIADAEAGPTLDSDASRYLVCHVDTFYETGLIVYSLRVSLHEPFPERGSVIIWIKSWVGSYTVQQLHLMFTLGEQCADGFAEDWSVANPG